MEKTLLLFISFDLFVLWRLSSLFKPIVKGCAGFTNTCATFLLLDSLQVSLDSGFEQKSILKETSFDLNYPTNTSRKCILFITLLEQHVQLPEGSEHLQDFQLILMFCTFFSLLQ